MYLNINLEVFSKIEYFLRRFPNTEWSGPLWSYYENSTQTFEILYFFPLDLGSTAATEFDGKDVNEIIKRLHEEERLYENTHIGLIHSHHNMAPAFSGTDLNTLNNNVPDEGYYLSLIVSHKGMEAKVIYTDNFCVKRIENLTIIINARDESQDEENEKVCLMLEEKNKKALKKQKKIEKSIPTGGGAAYSINYPSTSEFVLFEALDGFRVLEKHIYTYITSFPQLNTAESPYEHAKKIMRDDSYSLELDAYIGAYILGYDSVNDTDYYTEFMTDNFADNATSTSNSTPNEMVSTEKFLGSTKKESEEDKNEDCLIPDVDGYVIFEGVRMHWSELPDNKWTEVVNGNG